MIEPLRFNSDNLPPITSQYPQFCENCRTKKDRKLDPNIAIKFCPTCIHRKFVCKICDEEIHRLPPAKLHPRQLIVAGPGVTKRVISKGTFRSIINCICSLFLLYKTTMALKQ